MILRAAKLYSAIIRHLNRVVTKLAGGQIFSSGKPPRLPSSCIRLISQKNPKTNDNAYIQITRTL